MLQKLPAETRPRTARSPLDDAMPKPSKKGKGPRPPRDGQSFNQDALAQLTSRIDKSLDGGDHKRKQPPTAASDKQQPKRQRASTDATSRELNGSSVDQAALLAEIKALGGDESDLALINEVESDDETYAQDSKKPIDKALTEELAALSKELGFAALAPEEASDAEEGLEEEDKEDEEEEEEEDLDGDEEEGEEDEDDDEDVAPRKPGGMVCASASFKGISDS